MFGLDLVVVLLIVVGLQLYFVCFVQQMVVVGGFVVFFGCIDDFMVCFCCGLVLVVFIECLGVEGVCYLVCGLCVMQWYYVWVKCVCCQNIKGILLQSLVVVDDSEVIIIEVVVQVECCSECGYYFKLLYFVCDFGVELVVDDFVSLMLDLFVSSFENGGLQCYGVNLLFFFGEFDEVLLFFGWSY